MVNWSGTAYLTLVEALAALNAIANTTYAYIVTVTEANGKAKYIVVSAQAGLPSGATSDNIVAEGAASTKGCVISLDDGTDSQFAQCDTIGNLKVVSGYTTRTATIANGQSLSGEVDLEGYAVAAISMPATWTAADITFAVATATGGTFISVS